MTDFLTLAQERYSVRKFDNRPVAKEDIDRILRAGQLAPTACNFQPQRIFVLQSEDALAKMRKCTRCHFDAPLGLLVCYDASQSWKRKFDAQDSGWVDASIVTTHMMLAAHEIGVGSTWVMYFDPEAMRAEFELPENLIPAALLVMGYPAADAEVNPLHHQIKPIEDTVSYL